MQTPSPVVLVVEDDPDLRGLFRCQLDDAGYVVEVASDGARAETRLERGGIDLVLLDRRLPRLDGLTLCRRIRERDADLPIIMLTADIKEAQRLEGFAAGADDYVTKPFSLGELLARIQAVLRRRRPATVWAADPVVVDDRLQIDFQAGAAIVDGQRVPLRPTERRLLHQLVQRAGQTVTFEELLASVWGPEYRGATNYVHLYVTYLRRKLEPDRAHPRYILTNRGAGYRFCPLSARSAAQRSLLGTEPNPLPRGA
jgi:DNA-binding response OmpR family regulator